MNLMHKIAAACAEVALPDGWTFSAVSLSDDWVLFSLGNGVCVSRYRWAWLYLSAGKITPNDVVGMALARCVAQVSAQRGAIDALISVTAPVVEPNAEAASRLG